MSTDSTTVQISKKARERLQEIASFYRRSMTGQLEWMIDQAYDELAAEWGGAAKNETPAKGQLNLPLPE